MQFWFSFEKVTFKYYNCAKENHPVINIYTFTVIYLAFLG